FRRAKTAVILPFSGLTGFPARSTFRPDEGDRGNGTGGGAAGEQGMRRRRSRSRLVSCLAGTALLGGTAWIAPPIATTLIHDMLAKIGTAGSEANRKVMPDLVEAAPSAPPEAVG